MFIQVEYVFSYFYFKDLAVLFTVLTLCRCKTSNLADIVDYFKRLVTHRCVKEKSNPPKKKFIYNTIIGQSIKNNFYLLLR